MWLLDKCLPAVGAFGIRYAKGCSRRGWKRGLSLPLHALHLPCPVAVWPHAAGSACWSRRKCHFYFGKLLFCELNELDPRTAQLYNLRLPKHVAGTGEKRKQEHFFQQEPAARLDVMKSKAVTLKGNIAHVSNGAWSHVAAFSSLTWSLYPSQFPILNLQKHYCTEIFTHLWNTVLGHWFTIC